MKTTRRVMSVVLAIAMVLTTFGMVTVSAASYSDTTGHWAESYINVWSDYGVIQGDGGYFRPDDAITRAEVAQVTQNVISYEEAAENGFSDVPAGAWYEDAILKLAAAGTLTGNGDGTMSPDNYMTREEAMTMLARAYGLTVENSQAGITQYADYQTVSDYATGYVGAMTAAGYVSGYEDGTIRPQANISRAEFVKILDNMIKLYITAPGTYGPGYYGGIAMVKVGGVTLNGVVGNGAVISPQVSGEVALQNCQFTGNTVNLSKNASVTSNTGVNTSSQTSVPNTYYGNGPYSGSIGGSIGGGSNSVTVTFYYYDDFSGYEKVSVSRGNKLSTSKVPNPEEEGDDNWNGAWYKSKSAAENGKGTVFDPTKQAINTNTVLYAGRGEKVPDATAAPSTPTATKAPVPTATATATATATSAPSATAAPISEPSKESWSFDTVKAGTTYASGDIIKSADGMDLIIGVAEANAVPPTIKERAAGDYYLEFNDSTTSGSAKQDSWSYTPEKALECDKVVFSMDVNKSDLQKDTILFRVYDTNNTTAGNSYATDGRSFELKTGDNGSLAVVDYYSADSDGKAAQVTVPGASYSADKWFSVKAEYERNEKMVYIYAGETADTVELKAAYSLGSVGVSSKVTDIPVLAPTKVGCFTPGGGTVVLGMDNINVESVNYQAKEVPVRGTVYTTFSDDMKNQPEAYDSSINASITFTKKGESTPAATAEIKADGTYETQLMSDAVYEVAIGGASAEYSLSELSKTDLELSKKVDSGEKNVLFVKNLGDVQYKDTIEVGTNKECNTINKALSLVRKMNREAGQTVTIVVDAGTYEEQLYVDVEDIVLKAADENNKPTVQWYYGIGYLYYSAGSDGWYNADDAAAKTTKREVKNWGATLRTTKRGFRAENINFINTFNKYITDAEIADGVVTGGGSAKDFDRSNKNTEVRSTTATERAAAIYIGGSEIELYRCSFSSSQDTFGTGAASAYVKECDIAGNTDYICGGNNVFFDSCNLIWTGYSNEAKGGYLTACKTSKLPPEDLGYYFKNCTIKNSGESGMKFAAGSWGRSWGGRNCQVIFDNTSTASGVSKPGAWIGMGKENDKVVPVSEIGLYVINGVNGQDVSSNKNDNPHGTLASVPEPEDFFGEDWTPVYYVSDTNKFAIKKTAAENGSFTTEVNGVAASRAVEGDTVTVVPSPANNYEVDEIKVEKTASGEQITLDDNNSFTMPSEAVTVTVTFINKTMGIYADWNQGQANDTDTKGAMENIKDFNGKDTLHIIERNAYKVLDTPVSAGKATFDFDLYVDKSVARNFRVYLENETGFTQNTGNVFAEVLCNDGDSNNGNEVNYGPEISSKTSHNPVLFSYDDLDASGWVHFNIVLDYSKASGNDFITVTATTDSASLGTVTMGAISGKDTTLKSIRLVKTGAEVYFANMNLSID